MATSKDLKKLIDSFEAISEREQVAIRYHRLAASKRQRIVQKIKEAVKAGEKTDDPTVNFVLAKYGPNPKKLANYRAINKHLAGKIGELIAIFYDEEIRVGGTRDGWETKTRFCIAVLRDDKLRTDISGERPTCSLPIDSYVICVNPVARIVNNEKYELKKRSFVEQVGFEILKDPGSSHKEHPSEKYVAAIYAGTKQVRSLFAYEYLTFHAKDKKLMKRAEQDVGFLELESEESD